MVLRLRRRPRLPPRLRPRLPRLRTGSLNLERINWMLPLVSVEDLLANLR